MYVGLAPTTFSHGLLPIGRKGDPSASADSDPASSGNGNRRKTQQNLPNSEITRGPDTIDPVWLESLVKGGFNAAKTYFRYFDYLINICSSHLILVQFSAQKRRI